MLSLFHHQPWHFTKLFEDNIHLPDLSAAQFHCLAKSTPYDPAPAKLVQDGVLHPTVQFTNPDLAFFRYPHVHIKAQWIDGSGGDDGVVWDGYYQTPAKLTGLKPTFGPVWSSIDHTARLVKNILNPGGADWIHMKRICTPPNEGTRRLLITATPADSDNIDVLGGPVGTAVYAVKHVIKDPYITELNRGLSFL